MLFSSSMCLLAQKVHAVGLLVPFSAVTMSLFITNNVHASLAILSPSLCLTCAPAFCL